MKLNIHITIPTQRSKILCKCRYVDIIYCSKRHYSLCPRYMNVLLLLLYY